MKILAKIKGSLLVAMLVTMLVVPFSAGAFNVDIGLKKDEAPGITPEDTAVEALQETVKDTGLRSFIESRGKNIVDGPGLESITGAIRAIINLLKWSLGTVAVLFLLYTGMRLVTATDQADEVYTNAKKHFSYIAIGLFLVFAIDIFISEVFVLDDGNFLGSVDEAKQYARIGSLEIRGIYNFLQIFVGIIAVLMIVYHGVRLVANAGTDDVIDKAKRNITWGIAGLILVGISELLVKDILFVDQGSGFDLVAAKRLLVQLTNFASGFIATVAVVMAIYAGYLYIFSATGDDNTDKVKKTIIGAVIGLIIAGGAFAIVNTLVEFEQPDLPELLRDQVESGLDQ